MPTHATSMAICIDRRPVCAAVLMLLLSGCREAAETPTASEGPSQNVGYVATTTTKDSVLAEDFSAGFDLQDLQWSRDTHPQDGPFSDNGVYFQNKGVTPPEGFRATMQFGRDGWLTAELYSRSDTTALSDLVSVVKDPRDPANAVVRIASPKHTDAAVIRPTNPLPGSYRVSARVGFPNFGDGIPGANGYKDETATSEPWNSYEVRKLNGFYWLSILDAVPRPHNNVWIHHHRKLTIDSCNHFPAWMDIYNGHGWKKSGVRPVMMFVLDGLGDSDERLGKPFISYSGGEWRPSGEIKAVDAYKPNTWYDVSIERRPPEFTLSVSGDFKFGGQQTYRATINYEKMGVWHHNRPGEPTPDNAVDDTFFATLGPDHPHWPADKSWPDYFMLGEPHINFYEGEVLYDDVRLETSE